jgi:ATP-dependent Clp protease adaptor protein ClpS
MSRESTTPKTPAPPCPAVATKTRPRPTDPKLDRLPPFRVLLHNDDKHDMGEVVDWLTELTPLGRQPAVRIMLEAHTRGVAQVLITHRERAELYEDQLRSKGLVVTIEPVG